MKPYMNVQGMESMDSAPFGGEKKRREKRKRREKARRGKEHDLVVFSLRSVFTVGYVRQHSATIRFAMLSGFGGCVRARVKLVTLSVPLSEKAWNPTARHSTSCIYTRNVRNAASDRWYATPSSISTNDAAGVGRLYRLLSCFPATDSSDAKRRSSLLSRLMQKVTNPSHMTQMPSYKIT